MSESTTRALVIGGAFCAPYSLGMTVDVASPDGGVIPFDPQSLKPVTRTGACDRAELEGQPK